MYQPINGWTKEKIIQHIRTHFRGKSQDVLRCLYRGPEGKKCAVGMFIPDELYHPSMEGMQVEMMVPLFPKLSEVLPLTLGPIGLLQDVHDMGGEGLGDELIAWVKENVA